MDEATGLATARYFLGRWQMVRLIDDRAGMSFGEFWGEAVFAPANAANPQVRDPVSAMSGTAPGSLTKRELARPGGAESIPDPWVDSRAGVMDLSPKAMPAAADAPQTALLICRESGVLRLGGRDYAAGRVTRWHFAEDGGVRVAHDDGRAFHAFDPASPRALHLCGDDRYEVDYDFGADSWISRWQVTGPRKDYCMTTRYTRIPAEGSAAA